MDIDALRAQTPASTGRIHLNNADAALLAQPTLDAMTAQLRREAEIGGYEAAAEARDAITATYDAIARLIGGLANGASASWRWAASLALFSLRPTGTAGTFWVELPCPPKPATGSAVAPRTRARSATLGTIRGDYALDVTYNLVPGSANLSPASGKSRSSSRSSFTPFRRRSVTGTVPPGPHPVSAFNVISR